MKSFHHLKLRGGEPLLPFFPFCILESELISSNSVFLTNLFRANIAVKTLCNSTKKLYWLFTKEVIALTTSPTCLSRRIFYPRPTVIYVLVFFPSFVSFYKKTFISLSNITKRSLKKHLLILVVGFPFSFKLKIILKYCPRCVSIRFLEGIDSYPIRLVSLSESERSSPSRLWKSCRKKSVPMEIEGLSDMETGTEQ